MSVSMPFQGSSLFLQPFKTGAIIIYGLVSMPFQGSSLFLLIPEIVENYQLLICVNALSGLFFISTHYVICFNRTRRECQCPFRALLYFYYTMQPLKYIGHRLCQCPFRALLYFYRKLPWTNSRHC